MFLEGVFWKWRLMCLWVEGSLSLPDRNSNSHGPQDRSGKEQSQTRPVALADKWGRNHNCRPTHLEGGCVPRDTDTGIPGLGTESLSCLSGQMCMPHLQKHTLCFEITSESKQNLTQNNPHTQTHCHQNTHPQESRGTCTEQSQVTPGQSPPRCHV